MRIEKDPSSTSRASLAIAVFRLFSVGCLGVTILVWVADHAGPRAEITVHVLEPDVDLFVGEIHARVSGRITEPFQFSMPSGRHALRLSRHGALLHEEFFEVVAGETLVLSAWNSLGAPRSPDEVTNLDAPRAEMD